MTRARGAAEVLRVLDRYLVEVVERYALCPWARPARERGELAIGILWGAPPLEAWVAEAERLLALPGTRVAMIVAPELAVPREALSRLRDRVAARMPSAGVADFHPDAALDLATPARLVPFLRRSPDPLLQLVPLDLLDAVRAEAADAAGLAQQAAMLGGQAAPPRAPIADRIAAANHATVAGAAQAMTTALVDISRDRRAAYQRAGIAAVSVTAYP